MTEEITAMMCPLCDEIYRGEHYMYFDDELGYYICNHCADDREAMEACEQVN